MVKAFSHWRLVGLSNRPGALRLVVQTHVLHVRHLLISPCQQFPRPVVDLNEQPEVVEFLR
jgi:hypothetical protein